MPQLASVMHMADTPNPTIHIDNLEYWHDVFCTQVFHGECSNAAPGFKVSLWSHRIEEVQFNVISSTPHIFQRREKHARHAKLDEVVLTLQLSGTSIYRHDGRELTLQPCDMTCGDSTRPVWQRFVDDVSQLVVQISSQAHGRGARPHRGLYGSRTQPTVLHSQHVRVFPSRPSTCSPSDIAL